MVYVQICFVIIVNGRNTFRQIIKAFILFLRTLVRVRVLVLGSIYILLWCFFIKITAPQLVQCIMSLTMKNIKYQIARCCGMLMTDLLHSYYDYVICIYFLYEDSLSLSNGGVIYIYLPSVRISSPQRKFSIPLGRFSNNQ